MKVKFLFVWNKCSGVQLLGHMVVWCGMCSFLRSCCTVSQSSCAVLRSHQQRASDPVSPCQHLMSPFFIFAILVGVSVHLTAVLICMFLMANDV